MVIGVNNHLSFFSLVVELEIRNMCVHSHILCRYWVIKKAFCFAFTVNRFISLWMTDFDYYLSSLSCVLFCSFA